MEGITFPTPEVAEYQPLLYFVMLRKLTRTDNQAIPEGEMSVHHILEMSRHCHRSVVRVWRLLLYGDLIFKFVVLVLVTVFLLK